VSIGYESMVHVGVIRQAAKLIAVAVRRSTTGKGNGKDKGKGNGNGNGSSNIRSTTAAMTKQVYCSLCEGANK
jgi:hypothetical protein